MTLPRRINRGRSAADNIRQVHSDRWRSGRPLHILSDRWPSQSCGERSQGARALAVAELLGHKRGSNYQEHRRPYLVAASPIGPSRADLVTRLALASCRFVFLCSRQFYLGARLRRLGSRWSKLALNGWRSHLKTLLLTYPLHRDLGDTLSTGRLVDRPTQRP